MLESLKPAAGKRWPRGQRFGISPKGAVAEAAYREAVQAVRAVGRVALSAAQRAWALPLNLDPADGVILGELRTGRKTLAELAHGLEECGTSRAEVKAAVDRLSEAGLLDLSSGAVAAA
jgi:hypothetical protein